MRPEQLVPVFLALAAAFPCEAAERCAVLFETPDGKVERMFLQTLHVSGLPEEQQFALPAEAPSLVRSIQCGRASLVPGASDHKPLQAGFPLSIVAGGRIGVLEAVNGQLRFRMLEGEVNETESKLMQGALNEAQERFDRRASVTP